MQRLAQGSGERLRRTYFGSVLAAIGVVILTVAPVAKHCVGIAAVRGGQGGIFCDWTPPLDHLRAAGLLFLLLFTAVIVVVPLAFPNRWVLLATGVGSAMIVIGLIIGVTANFRFYLALYNLGLGLTGAATTGMLALLPASVAWIVAGLRTSPA